MLSSRLSSYLNELRSRYYKLWAKYTKAPIYIVDTPSINYIDEEEGQQKILSMIDGWLSGNPVDGALEAYTLEEVNQNQHQLDLEYINPLY